MGQIHTSVSGLTSGAPAYHLKMPPGEGMPALRLSNPTSCVDFIISQ
ncbi:MAG: hypothetical protein ACI92S_001777 [Planctomycetaceae bacterium]